MAEAATIARPYAKAVFMSARDTKALPAWSESMRAGMVLVAEPRVAELLGDPKVGIDQLVALFSGLAGPWGHPGEAADQLEARWENFVRLLATNKRLELLPEITLQFEMLRAQYENELDVQVTSAVAMSAEQQGRLAAALKKRFQREIRITTAIDPALLGGAVIRAGDLVIDGSINGRLQRLAADLVN